MDVVVTFALDLEGRVEGDVLLRARLDVDFLNTNNWIFGNKNEEKNSKQWAFDQKLMLKLVG
jgi:hypothetical protein